MNQVSLRASPGGATAFSCHCKSRCVLVKQPSFSAWPAVGRKNTSVESLSRQTANPPTVVFASGSRPNR
jgi:hypothetical protein